MTFFASQILFCTMKPIHKIITSFKTKKKNKTKPKPVCAHKFQKSSEFCKQLGKYAAPA